MGHDCTEPGCSKSLSSSSHLKRHLVALHGPCKFECVECGKRFKHEAQLKSHIAAKIRQCSFCGKTLSSKPHLERHYLTHIGEKNVKCSLCSYKCFDASSLRNHMLVHTDEAEFECPEPGCGRKLKSQGRLSQHVWEVHRTPKQSHVCSICGKAFAKRGVLQRHTRIHTCEKPHGCSFCELKFSGAPELRNHVARVHTKEKPHSCKVTGCRKSFINVHELRRHEKTAHASEDEKKAHPHVCEFCGHRFPDADHWRRHVNRHTGEKKFACPVCLRAFKCSSNMSRHMRVHTGEKPHSCSICGNKFRTTGDRKDHISRVHTREKPYSCRECGRRFVGSSDLASHKRTHAGAARKMFACNFCERSFTTRPSRDAHQRRRHDDGRVNAYKCEFCDYSGFNTAALTRHRGSIRHIRAAALWEGVIRECQVVLTRVWVDSRR